MPNGFVEAQRNSTGLLTAVERRVLLWLAHRLPARVNSDHLTALGLVSMFFVGVCFAVSRAMPAALWGVVFFLALNWFGDSLDGTLARVRGHQRPRYGFYVDHILDTFGALFVLGGLAHLRTHDAYRRGGVSHRATTCCRSRSISRRIASGRFQMSFWGWGPTELRILLADRRADAAGETDRDHLRRADAVVRCRRHCRRRRADFHCDRFGRREYAQALRSRTAAAEFAVSTQRHRVTEHATRHARAAFFSAGCVSRAPRYASILRRRRTRNNKRHKHQDRDHRS